MIRIDNAGGLRSQLNECRAQGKRIALVPTMGNIHAGHISLVGKAQTAAQVVVVSVFINPIQFDHKEDFDHYPRTLDEDGSKLEAAGTDILFCPTVDGMYPNGLDLAAYVDVTHSANDLEGEMRPGHFRGMATVVNKLFNLVQPDVAVFGQKDWQQLAVIKAMVAELFMPLLIMGAPTVREADGLAMSSRNGHLNSNERALAGQLYKQLQLARGHILRGERNYQVIEKEANKNLTEAGFQVDYFSVRNVELQPATQKDQELVILLAAWLGKTRLIDNLPFTISD